MADNQKKKYQDIQTAYPYGMNSGVAPLLLPREQVSFALNTTFRGGYATNRPAREKLTLNFGGDDDLEAAVRTGFFQGAGVYRPDFGPSQNIAQIGGRLFTFTENGTVWDVAEITIAGDANDATTSQVWMWQAEKWMIISDGSGKLPIFYDGVSCRRSYGPSVTLGEVVVGVPVNFPNPRVIGEVIQVTMAAPWENPVGTAGPFNVPVRFNGAIYQPIASTTTSIEYGAILTNVNSARGTNVPAGAGVIVQPGFLGQIISVVSGGLMAPDGNQYVNSGPSNQNCYQGGGLFSPG